jgi:hypothetical protein
LTEIEKENQRLNEKVTEYENRALGGNFSLKINFETDISKIDVTKLRTEINDDLQRDYELIALDVEKVVSRVGKDFERVFSKTELFVMKDYIDTARLIEFIEAGNKIYPPILTPIDNDTIVIRDGNHRIGLLRFLGHSPIPFLVKKVHLKFVVQLK